MTTTKCQVPVKSHMRERQRLGVFRETKIPVTDPMDNQAREPGRRAGGGGTIRHPDTFPVPAAPYLKMSRRFAMRCPRMEPR